MLTRMTDEDWSITLKVFDAARSRARVSPAETTVGFWKHYIISTVHNVTWRALPAEFGNWNRRL